MTYRRVIPRDLFNEANLLKCYGQLALLIDHVPTASFQYGGEGDDGSDWDIRQNQASGGIYADNLILYLGGQIAYLERPLNSRRAWPLYLERLDGEELPAGAVPVFDDDGQLSDEFMALVPEGMVR